MIQEDGREVMTYSSDKLPTHYGFMVASRVERLERDYRKVLQETFPENDASKNAASRPGKVSDETAAKVRKVIDLLDARGAWVEQGKLRTYKKHPEGDVIRSQSFIDNVRLLSGYLHSLEK